MIDVDYDTYCSMQKQPSKKRKIYLNFGSQAIKKANFRKHKLSASKKRMIYLNFGSLAVKKANFGKHKLSASKKRKIYLKFDSQAVEKAIFRKNKLSDREVIKIGKHYVDPSTYKTLDCKCKVVGEVSCSQYIENVPGIDRAKMSCKICLSKGDHDTESCSYLKFCPPGVKIDDSVARKFCHCCSARKCFFRPGEEDKQPGYCMLKGCCNCMTMGDHWSQDCPFSAKR